MMTSLIWAAKRDQAEAMALSVLGVYFVSDAAAIQIIYGVPYRPACELATDDSECIRVG
jgi:hypothetical protein